MKSDIEMKEMLLGGEKDDSSDDSEMSFCLTENSSHGSWLTEPADKFNEASDKLEKALHVGSKDDKKDSGHLYKGNHLSASNRFNGGSKGLSEKYADSKRIYLSPPGLQKYNARFHDPSDHEGKYGPWFEGPDPFGDIMEDGIPYDGPYESSDDDFDWSEHESGSEIDSFLGGSRRKKLKKPLGKRLPPKPATHYRSLLVNGRRPARRRNTSSSEDTIPQGEGPEKKAASRKKKRFWDRWRIGVVDAHDATTISAQGVEKNESVAT